MLKDIKKPNFQYIYRLYLRIKTAYTYKWVNLILLPASVAKLIRQTC
jgi:hypothetical protein